MRDGFFLLPRPGPCQRHDPFPIPARAGTHAVAWADARPCSSGDRAPDSGSGCRPFESGQGHFGAVAQWQGVPFATGRSRVRIPPAPRHAACRRVEAQTFRGTTSRQDGAPPAMEYADSGLPPAVRETAGPAGPSTGRPHKPGVMGPDPVPRDADVVQRQHACFPSRRPRVRIPSSALSGSIGFRCISSPDSVPGAPETHGRPARAANTRRTPL